MLTLIDNANTFSDNSLSSYLDIKETTVPANKSFFKVLYVVSLAV